MKEGENQKDNRAKAYFCESRRVISKKLAYRLVNEGRRLSVAFSLLVVLRPIVRNIGNHTLFHIYATIILTWNVRGFVRIICIVIGVRNDAGIAVSRAIR